MQLRFNPPEKKDALPSSPPGPSVSARASSLLGLVLEEAWEGSSRGPCQESAVSSQREAGARSWRMEGSPRGSHNWGCFKLQPGFQRSCRLRSPKTLSLEEALFAPVIGPCWPGSTALGLPPPGAGRWLPEKQAPGLEHPWKWAAGPASLLAPLTPSPSATRKPPKPGSVSTEGEAGAAGTQGCRDHDRVWGIFPLGAGPLRPETRNWDVGRPRPSAEPGRPVPGVRPTSDSASPPGAQASEATLNAPFPLLPRPRRHPAVSLAVAQHV